MISKKLFFIFLIMIFNSYNIYSMEQEQENAVQECKVAYNWVHKLADELINLTWINVLILKFDNQMPCNISSVIQDLGLSVLKIAGCGLIWTCYWRYKYKHLFDQSAQQRIIGPLKKDLYTTLLISMSSIACGVGCQYKFCSY